MIGSSKPYAPPTLSRCATQVVRMMLYKCVQLSKATDASTVSTSPAYQETIDHSDGRRRKRVRHGMPILRLRIQITPGAVEGRRPQVHAEQRSPQLSPLVDERRTDGTYTRINTRIKFPRLNLTVRHNCAPTSSAYSAWQIEHGYIICSFGTGKIYKHIVPWQGWSPWDYDPGCHRYSPGRGLCNTKHNTTLCFDAEPGLGNHIVELDT